MGKLLQVRVSAGTWDESEVPRRWPGLCKLAWPEGAGMDKSVPAFAQQPRGVLELAQALQNGIEYGDWPEQLIAALKPALQKLGEAQAALAAALAAWDASSANRQTEAVETALDQAEDIAWRTK